MVGVFLWVASAVAWAEEFPSGGATAEEFEKGFQQKGGLSKSDEAAADVDRLKITGVLWNEVVFGTLDSSLVGVTNYLSSPQSLWLTMDAQLKGDVRGLARLKAVYDPSVDPSVAHPLSGQFGVRTRTDLEELKLLFNAKKRVFFTFGKQKIKWGSGKFWNPTDFLNASQRNVFYSTDLRSGLPLLKAHAPVGGANFYWIEGFENADRLAKLRHAVRAEVAVGPGEMAMTAATRPGQAPSFGADVSSAIGDFDVYAEVGRSASVTNWVAGVSYEAPVGDNDSVTFSAEYFRNGAGQTSTSNYLTLLATGLYEPFRLSRDYGLFSLYLPKPGAWNQASFTLIQLINLTDSSQITRLDALLTFLDDLSINLAGAIHYGNSSGEFRLGGQRLDLSARLMISF